MYILHVDSSMGIPVQKLQQCPHSTKGYRDTVDYQDIFTVTIMIVKFHYRPALKPNKSKNHTNILFIPWFCRKLNYLLGFLNL